MVVRLTLAALATPSMVSPGNPTRASSAMVAARTFSTTCWLRGPRCTPLVRRVELSIAHDATQIERVASVRCHLLISELACAASRVNHRSHADRWRYVGPGILTIIVSEQAFYRGPYRRLLE